MKRVAHLRVRRQSAPGLDRAHPVWLPLVVGLGSLVLGCSDFEGYGPIDTGRGGQSNGGRGGNGGAAGTMPVDAGRVPDASSGGSRSDAGTPDAGAPDAAAPDATAPDASLPPRYAACQAICETQTQLEECQPSDNCVEDLCGEAAIQALPPDCVDEYDAYYACLAGEPATSFTCSGSTPMQSVGNHGCLAQECEFFTCIGLPGFCSL